MTSIIMRSALEAWGRNPAPEIASIVIDGVGRRVVTWDDVMRARRDRQQLILDRKRNIVVVPRRACKLWVGYFGRDLFGGWHAFLENRDRRVWIDRDDRWTIPRLLELFPLVLNLDGADRWGESWHLWKLEFAKAFERRKQRRQPLGVAYVWQNNRNELQRINAALLAGEKGET